MTKFVALIRGIGPTNPNMRNNKLKEVFEYLGFTNVDTVLASGNVVFEYWMKSTTSLEWHIEKALEKHLGLKNSVIVKTRKQLLDLLNANPFKGHEDVVTSRFNVTFLKKPIKDNKAKETVKGSGYKIVGSSDTAIFSTVDQTGHNTVTMMTDLEKAFGKNITTRTWKTIHRILGKWE